MPLPYAVVIATLTLAMGGGFGSAVTGVGAAEVRAVRADLRAMEAKVIGRLDVLTARDENNERVIRDHEDRLRTIERQK
jgi:hypothetical protein